MGEIEWQQQSRWLLIYAARHAKCLRLFALSPRHTLRHCKWYIHANFLIPPLIFMWIYVKVGVNFGPTWRVWLADCCRLFAAALKIFFVILVVTTVVCLSVCLTTWHAKSVFELWGVTNVYWVVIFVCDEIENHDSWQLMARPQWWQWCERGERLG